MPTALAPVMQPHDNQSTKCAEILVVEDSPTQAATLKNTLEQQLYQVVVARDGAEALSFLSEHTPTLIITDINMPDMDGYELCRRIRADQSLREIPVILLTSLADPKDVLKGLECGADNFITKPYDKKQLLSRIQNICSSFELRRSERMQMGVEVFFGGRRHFITSERQQILDLLLATYEAAVQVNLRLQEAQDKLRVANQELEKEVANRTMALEQELLERKRAEEQIREQAELLDKARDSIYVTDTEGRIRFWNKSAEQLYGWTMQEVLGRNADEMFFPAEVISRKGEVISTVLRDKAWTGELRQRTQSGQEFLIEAHLTLVQDSTGNPKSILYIVTDITEKKRLESHVLRTQRLESLGTLASGVAHDLNNALAPILMGAEMLRMDNAFPASQEMIETIESSARRGAEMVRQLLTFAKGAEGARLLIQSRHLFQEIEKIVKCTFPKGIQLRTSYAKNLHLIRGDATQLHQVLLNLCVNARDAMPDGGSLSLEAQNEDTDAIYATAVPEARPGKYVVWRITDTGTGITAECLERIFEPFFSTKGPEKGTGLGLSTVAGIVKGHGGFIRVSSTVGKGSAFSIYLPAESAAAPDQPLEKEARFRGNGQTILVVDDEESIRRITRAVLTKLNFKVLTAADGAEAIIQVVENRAELRAVITDVNMPNMDGLTFVRLLRRMLPHAEVIIASGQMQEREENEFESLAVSALLRKPFNQEELVEALKTVFQDSEHTSSNN